MTSATSGLLLAVATAFCAVAGLLCLAALAWLRRATGFRTTAFGRMPEVVASDTGHPGVAPAVLLRDPALGLVGRPDYLIEERAEGGARSGGGGGGTTVLVPVESKPSRRSRRLYESDAVQLGAYLVALRATVGGERAANHGYVHYAAGTTFRVELTGGLEARVREIVAAVRAGRRAGLVHRSHRIAARCAACPVRERCDERLA